MMAKCHRNLTPLPPLLLLPPDLLGWLFELLGLHGLNLRATCRHLSQHPLSEGVALAHKVIKVGPSIPLRMHVPRRTTRGVAHSRWDYFGYRASLVWRTEWALALKDIDAAPIRALLDAHAAFPPDDCWPVRAGWIGAGGGRRPGGGRPRHRDRWCHRRSRPGAARRGRPRGGRDRGRVVRRGPRRSRVRTVCGAGR